MSEKSSRTGRQLERTIALAAYLQGREDASFDEVCAHLEVDRRTLGEDLDTLAVCGLPPYSPDTLFTVEEAGGRVRLRAEPLHRQFAMPRSEAVRLLAGGRIALGLPGVDNPQLASAVEKLARSVGADPLVTGTDDRAAVHYSALYDAVAAQHVVHLTYLSLGQDEMSERDVEPVRLVIDRGSTYLVAWCRDVEGVRTFRLDRIGSVVDTGEVFEPRALAEEPVGYVARGDDLRAVIRVDRRGAWVQSAYPVERAEQRPDGTVEIEIAGDEAFLVRLLMGLAGHVVSVEPDWLRALVSARVAAVGARYD